MKWFEMKQRDDVSCRVFHIKMVFGFRKGIFVNC